MLSIYSVCTAATCSVQVPADYDACYKGFASQGARVIALAHKALPADMGPAELRALSRDEVESRLEFVGFAVFQVGYLQRRNGAG